MKKINNKGVVTNMNLLHINKRVLEYYRGNVSGNKHTSYLDVVKKLTRNIMLAANVPSNKDDEHRKYYMYGNLHMLVVKNKIVWIRNFKGKCDWFYKNKEKYKQLNSELGIDRHEADMSVA